MKRTPDPGFYYDVPADDYFAWDALHFSSLKYAPRSLAHYRHRITHPPDQTQRMMLGSATHAATLQPDEFALGYAKAPQCDRRTKKGKETWAAFQLEHEHAIVLKPEEYELCEAMSAAAWAHPLAAELLKGTGFNEVSVVWPDPETGLLCKCRVDRITAFDGATHVVDLKTTQDASPRGFAKAVANFDYHQQAAHYLDGMDAIDARPRRFTFIAVENEPPHCVAVYTLSEWAVDQGRDEMRDAKLAVAAARESGEWPGYANEIVEIELPAWRQRRADV